MISQITIERIKSAAQIQDVVSDYVSLRRRGVNMIGLCPFHSEKTPSFTVSPAKGICKCFGCGKGGDAIGFIMEIEQLNYKEAAKWLAKKYNIEVEDEAEQSDEEKAVASARENMLLINDFAQKYFSETLHNHPDGKAIGMAYYRERGIHENTIEKFGLGYSRERRDDFTQAALRAGYNKEYVVKTGLTIESESGALFDRFQGRVMFPVHTLSGKVVAFGGRVLKTAEKTAKYVNSPESELYHKSNELYGIFFAKKAISKADRCYLVEGYTDVISMHQSGIENVVASSGTSLTSGQIRLIHRFTNNLTLLYDGDAAGIKASIRGIDMLLEEGMNIKVLLLPDGEDPDSFARKTNASDFVQYIESNSEDFIRFKIKLLTDEAKDDPHKRAALKQDVIQSISVIPDALVRAEYAKECAALLQMEEAAVYAELNKLKRKQQTDNIKEQEREAMRQQYQPKAPEVQPLPAGKFEKVEKNLLRLMLLYGQESVFSDANEQLVSVAQFVFSQLEQNAIGFENPVLGTIAQIYRENMHTNDFDAKKYFTCYPDAQISQLSNDLIQEKYTISKVHNRIKKIPEEKEHLPEQSVRLINELLNSHLLLQEKTALQKLKEAANDPVLMQEAMDKIMSLRLAKIALSTELGNRIIIKI